MNKAIPVLVLFALILGAQVLINSDFHMGMAASIKLCPGTGPSTETAHTSCQTIAIEVGKDASGLYLRHGDTLARSNALVPRDPSLEAEDQVAMPCAL